MILLARASHDNRGTDEVIFAVELTEKMLNTIRASSTAFSAACAVIQVNSIEVPSVPGKFFVPETETDNSFFNLFVDNETNTNWMVVETLPGQIMKERLATYGRRINASREGFAFLAYDRDDAGADCGTTMIEFDRLFNALEEVEKMGVYYATCDALS